MFYFIGIAFVSFLTGAFTVFFAIFYFAYKYKDELFRSAQKPQVKYEKNQLGSLLHYNLHSGRQMSTLGEKESCCFVNVLFAFIFREWRDTNQLQKWVQKKINVEFMEFMETKTASRLLQGLKIHDVSLGTNFPVFHSAKIKEPFSFTDSELPETVILEVEMEYLGGFYLAIDVDLVFGKTAFLAVRITYLRGRIRLHFGRQPCTHWSLCFIEEPDIKFDVETSFETRQLPQLTSLIVNQIRRTIKRKHTFPHYKMRYNPFFSFQHSEPGPFEGFIADIPIQLAILEVSVAAATRLLISSKGEKERNLDSPNYVIFATLSVNEESCIGKSLLNYISLPTLTGKNGNTLPVTNDASPLKVSQAQLMKSPATPFNTLQRSLLGLKKEVLTEFAKKPQPIASSSSEKQEDPKEQKKDDAALKPAVSEPTPSQSSANSNPTYVMVALNFGATLREETKNNGQKTVIVENITEHNEHARSGMKDGDTVVELNGVAISSLSQAIATIERIRADKESFKFKVKRNRPDLDLTGRSQTASSVQDSDKSSTSMDTESDHSDVESEDYQDFVNISLQMTELHLKEGVKRRSASIATADPSTSSLERTATEKETARRHTGSVSNSAGADVPYMTLVSSPTPSTSSQSLKDFGGGDGSLTPNHGREQKKTEKGSVKTKLDKIMSPRSRSESPPFFRKSGSPAKKASPRSQPQKGKKDVKKEFPVKKDASARNKAENVAESSKAASSSKLDSSDQASTAPKSENLTYARVDDDHESQIFKTSLANSNQREYSWDNEKFSFNLKEKHRYLNIRYWTRQVNKLGIIKTKPPQIIGCIAVPLCEIEMHCRGVTSRRVTRRFSLSPPNDLPHDHKWFLNDPVSSRPSFREQYCYGDTTLTMKLTPNQANRNNSSNHFLDGAGTYYPNDETNGMLTKEALRNLSQKSGSDYLLSVPSSKGPKLLVSRESQTIDPTSAPVTSSGETVENCQLAEDITAIENSEVKDQSSKAQEKVSLTQMIKGFLQSGKASQDPKKTDRGRQPQLGDDAPNSGDLSNTETKSDDVIVGVVTKHISGLHQFEQVKFSKPTKCSFCRNKLWMKSGMQCVTCLTICHKRCVEKFKKQQGCSEPVGSGSVMDAEHEGENYVVVDTDAEDCSNASDSDGLPTAALSFRNKILDMTSPSKDVNSNNATAVRLRKNTLSKNAEDLLAINAKEMGRDLHRDLPLSERKKMLESQTQKAESELHTEIATKEGLLEEQKQYDSVTLAWKKIDKKIVKSDERLQALALLLLHFRAGLEDCEFETTEEGMILSDDEDEKYGVVGSKLSASTSKTENEIANSTECATAGGT